MLSRNGIRQPHESNESPSAWLNSDTAPVESSRPIGTPTCGQLATSPRRRWSPHSIESVIEPPHSPPTPMPCRIRSTTSSIGAHTPIDEYVGITPIAKLARPISSSVEISVALRPIRSPQWPKIAAPTGRAARPTA